MSTQCTPLQPEFSQVGSRRLVVRFDGGTLTSNAGARLLRAVEACAEVCLRAADRRAVLAGKSTMDRLEFAGADGASAS